MLPSLMVGPVLSPGTRSVTGHGAAAVEHSSTDANELPRVRIGREGEHEHAEVLVVPDLEVRIPLAEGGEPPSAASDDELADAVRRWLPIWTLFRVALVVVLVSVQDDVGARGNRG